MLTLKNIPNEVFLVTLDHMGQDRPVNPSDARESVMAAESRCGYQNISARQMGRDLGNLTAFGLALAQYVSLSGPFNEEDGEFAGVNGCRVE